MKLFKILPVILITACTTSSKTPESAELQDSTSTYTLEEAKAIIKKDEETKKAKSRENELLYERNKAIRNNWDRYVLVTTDYQSIALGGIRNLYVGITNKLPFLIESISVDIVYLKSNGDTYKVENLEFNNIHSGSADTLALSDTDRGVKIEAQVRSIYSPRLNFCYQFPMRPGDIKDSEDAYRCK